MANPVINTILSFATKGTGGVKNDVKSVVSSVDGASSAIGNMSKKLQSIQKGVAFQSVVAAAGAVKESFSTISDVIGGAISTVYGLAAAQAAVADKVGKTAALLGMQAGELQALRSAAQHAGMGVESLDSAMQKFSIATSRAAAGEKTQLELFNALGVATKNSDGSIRNQTDLLLDAADAYAKITNEQDRNRVSQELFGRSAVQMSALLKNGSAGLKSAIEEYQKTGAGYTNEQTEQAAAFNDQLQTMQEYVGGVKNQLFFALVPAFTQLFDGVSSFISENRGEISSVVSDLSKQLPSVIKDVTNALPAILSGVSKVASVVSAIVDFTGPWVPLLTAAGAVIGGSLLAAVLAVGVAVSTVGAAFGGVIAAAAPIVGIVALAAVGVAAWGKAIYEVYGNWELLKSFVVDDVYPAIVSGLEELGQMAMEAISPLIQGWESLKSFVVDGVFPAFVSGLKQFANSAIDVFATIADGVAKIPVIGNVAEGVGDWWRSQKFDVGSFDAGQVPGGAESSSNAAGSPAATSSNLTVDFRGVPRGTSITPGANFDNGSFDYSAGFAFGG